MTTISATNNWTIDFQDEETPGSGEKIQEIIDNNANNGDTLIFSGNSYTNVYLEINKPLNIISNVNTTISSCPSNPDKPIFKINPGGIGTNISGFQLTLNTPNSVAIFINNSNNVKIENNYIISGGYGIKIENSNNTIIKDNSIKNSNIALSLFASNSAKILENIITDNQEGIIFDGNTSNCEVSRNNVSKNQGNGIALLGGEPTFHSNMLINYNYINDNQDGSGIFINSSFPNMKILSNMIVNNGQHGIFFGLGSNKTDQSIIIEYNWIMNNKGYLNFEILRMDTSYEERIGLNIGFNFFGGTSRGLAVLCSNTRTGIIVPQLTKVSNGLYRLSYMREALRTLVTEMIPHYMDVYLNDYYITIFVNGGTALIDFREHIFKNNGNQISVYYRYPVLIQINNNEIPIKSVAISTSTNQNNVQSGGVVQYTTTVRNNGDKKVQNIQIRELIPNFNVYSFTVSIGSFNMQTGVWTILLMNPGEIATLIISFKADRVSTYKTMAILTGDGFNLRSNEITLNVEEVRISPPTPPPTQVSTPQVAPKGKAIISSSNRIKSTTIRRNRSTQLISTIRNTGTITSNNIRVRIQLPKGLRVLSQSHRREFNRRTNTWIIKVPPKRTIQLKMNVRGLRKANFRIVFNINGKKQIRSLRVI